jgi:indole-3-glycerol phosphate synthase
MTDILQKICADTRKDVEKAKTLKPLDILHREALRAPPTREFVKALRLKNESNGIGFIAEIKKASPSSGLIRPCFYPADLARTFARAGAACLSIVTDENYFQGSNNDLVEARASCELPVLRNDLVLDVWQVAEARAMGADCIILILAALDDETAAHLYQAAVDYGMDVIIEACDREELQRALKLPARLISIPSRNRKTLKVNIMNAADVIGLTPLEKFVVGAGGITTIEEIAYLKKAGARGFIVGEALLKQDDVGMALHDLMKRLY